MNIEEKIKDIVRQGAGIVYNDDGPGTGGPGYATPETIKEMIEAGDFADAEIVPLDADLQKYSFESVECPLCDETEWIQIEFSRKDNGYHQIAWIW